MAALLVLGAAPVWAQRVQAAGRRPAVMQPTFRADVIAANDPSVMAAAGVQVAGAYNIRLGLEVGAGGVSRAAGWQPAGRADLLLRWLSDPFRASRWGLNAGGGLGVLVERGLAPRPVAIITIGVDGPQRGSWLRGVEVGLGGGVRAGVTLRRASGRRR